MKRIFSILAIVCLVVALAVPTLAAETTKSAGYMYSNALVDIGGAEQLPKLPNSLQNYDNIVIYRWNSYYHAMAWNGEVQYRGNTWGVIPLNTVTVQRYTSNGVSWVFDSSDSITPDTQMFMLDHSGFFWTYNDLNISRVSNGFVDSFMGDSLYSYFVPEVCDGSTCPATDINFDDICDECGMTLAYNLRQTPDSYEVVVKHSDSLTLLYRYTETIDGTTFSAVYNDSRVTISFNNPVDHYQYKLVNGVWEDYASYPNTSGSHVISLAGTAEIESSDLIVYDTAGNVFFQNPLWKMILGLTQGEMTTAAQAVVGTMRVLVLCGVGLIALLVVLKLFGKRSLLYRG